MEIEYTTFIIVSVIVLQSIGAAKYIAGLVTRIAVLESKHETIDEDLKEIKQDVKELLRAVTS